MLWVVLNKVLKSVGTAATRELLTRVLSSPNIEIVNVKTVANV